MMRQPQEAARDEDDEAVFEQFRVVVRVKPLLLGETPAFRLEANGRRAAFIELTAPQPRRQSQVTASSDSGLKGSPTPSSPQPQPLAQSPLELPPVFEATFDERATTTELYNERLKPLIDGLFCGFNTSILAYGQTASGKSWTMLGAPPPHNSPGVIGHALKTVFEHMEASMCLTGHMPQLFFGCFELIFDRLTDLNSGETGLHVASKGRIMKDASCKEEHRLNGPLRSADEVLALLREANARRSTESTKMNAASSRSHFICQLLLKIPATPKPKASAVATTDSSSSSDQHLEAICNFVDLCGSERARKLGGFPKGRETGAINTDLSKLKHCIEAVARGTEFVHFRDTKLTHLLERSLRGKARTAFICCVSQELQHWSETKQTLAFARDAEKICAVARKKRVKGSLQAIAFTCKPTIPLAQPPIPTTPEEQRYKRTRGSFARDEQQAAAISAEATSSLLDVTPLAKRQRREEELQLQFEEQLAAQQAKHDAQLRALREESENRAREMASALQAMQTRLQQLEAQQQQQRYCTLQ